MNTENTVIQPDINDPSNPSNPSRHPALASDGYRLLALGEDRQEGDELILFDTDGTVKYWKWDARFDCATQGKIGQCKQARRKITQQHDLGKL